MSTVRLVQLAPDGARVEHVCPLPAELGRDAGSALVLDDPTVSRRHARIERTGGRLVLTDLGSGNGTYLRDERVTTTVLRPGDRIRVGSVDLVVDPPPDGPPPAATLVVDVAQQRAARALVSPRTAPARRVLAAAEAHNRAAGHDLAGSLSRAHGFLPAHPPETAFPASHAAWDQVVARLPALFRSLRLRRVFDSMPVLDAGPEALPDRYLQRAATLLGVTAHAYQYLTVDPPAALPPSLLEPWRTVSGRLGRDVPAVSYVDLFFANWRLRDPDGPRRLANLDLLVPTWDNPAERIFYLVTTEFAMALTPVVGAMVDAQQAVLDEDRTALAEALLVVHDTLRHVTGVVYPQIDPNPFGATHLDQVVWAKTVGTAGVPIHDGAPSPSGTAQPHIHALDAFLGRTSFGTVVGQQSVYLAGHFPRHWQEFVTALRAVSVRDFVERTGDRTLRGLHNAVLDAYVGDRGWMGAHRIKAYGFLEVSFKVGRQVTTGARFTGLFKDRTWDRVDDELAAVATERRPPVGPAVVFGRPRIVELVRAGGDGWVGEFELDVAGQGVHHQPGDRVGVFPENDAALVRRTLRALQATGDEIVALTPEWQAAVALRAGHSADTAALPLVSLLTFGRIRPVDRGVAQRLLALSAAGALARVVGARMEDQWELWDLLGLVAAAGYDVTRLWTCGPGDPGSICRVVPPERARLYSIASAMSPAETASVAGAGTLRLVASGLSYRTPQTAHSYPQDRRGSGSWFLRRCAEDPGHRNRRLSLQVVPAPRFRLPTDPARPVVMIAGGSGVAPFLGFAQARARQPGSGPVVLLHGVRTAGDVIGRAALERLQAAGGLEWHLALSREDGVRVPDLLARPEQADRVWDLLGPGADGHVYVCGRATFAAAVLTALTELAASRLGSGPDGVRFVRELTAAGRLQLDVFTTYRGHAQAGRVLDISDLVLRTTPERGCWTAIGGTVFDMSEFVHLHPGGPHLVRHNLGLDATEAYRRVLHDRNPEIDALLAMYEIGSLRRLQFGAAWAVVLTPDGLRAVPLERFFTAWVRFLYLAVGMADALRSDFGFAAGPTTGGELPGAPTRFTAQFVVEAHRRFLVSYLDGLLADDLRELWAATVGFCAPGVDVRELGSAVEDLAADPAWAAVRRTIGAVKDRLLDGGAGGWSGGERVPPEVQAMCDAWAEEDLRVMEDLVAALRRGVLAFEAHEEDVVARGGAELLAALREVPAVVAGYYRRLAARTADAGFTDTGDRPDVADEPVPEDRGIPGHGGPV